eukprot:CAMPEP_0202956206 /NCGR_PEP_ID=MMETSP1396-20130829/734_1 /ASSEMBLY_ACC=CAM_ASM_000872 /TAXON_ID= /ORGANISM="Pseudokeronopsis sp., Strain Brazil" /LENGTH=211 /DNA_ID=CAMNT_0049673123 /DNA_START=141 /DNA_END=777 /DNA_ORIENTATION=-
MQEGKIDKRKTYLANAEKYYKEYTSNERKIIEAKREAKKAGNFYVEGEPKIALVIRIKGINKLPPKQKKIMQLLRLRQLHNAVFVKLNKATINMIRLVEPYITFGYPTRKTISDLVYKRGFGKVNNQRIPLTDNEIVEQTLGKKGLVCVEDVINEIATVGPNFKDVNNFLWPFKLNSPRKGIEKKRHPYLISKGAFGNREEKINNLIKKMI